jgi:hypothetical protein
MCSRKLARQNSGSPQGFSPAKSLASFTNSLSSPRPPRHLSILVSLLFLPLRHRRRQVGSRILLAPSHRIPPATAQLFFFHPVWTMFVCNCTPICFLLLLLPFDPFHLFSWCQIRVSILLAPLEVLSWTTAS